MSIEITVVKQEPPNDSSELAEDEVDKNRSKSFVVETEFVRIKEEIDETSTSTTVRIKGELADNDVPLTNLDKNDTSNKVKVEISLEHQPVESGSLVNGTPQTSAMELFSNSLLTLSPDENVENDLPSFANGYANRMSEKKFDEGYAKEVNTISFINNDNNIFNSLIDGENNKQKKRKERNIIKQKNKMNAILEKLYRESLKKDLTVTEQVEDKNGLFDGKVQVVDVVSTPEVKEESFYNDSDSGGSNPTFPVLTIREGFPVPGFNLDDRHCPVCHEGFSSPANMQRHFHIHTKNTNYECKICNIKFWRRQEMTKHMYRHDVREFECEICHRRFKSKSNLNQHVKCHTVRYACEICEKSYPNMALYEKHKSRNLCRRKGALLRCKICFKGFKYECSLKCHLRRHSPDRPYICDMCPMDFETKREIENHINYHTRSRPFKCAVCPKRFANMAFRRAHMRIHTGEKPYKCPLCEKHFTHKHNMERHTEGHTREKKLVCDVCGRKFPRESRLVYHMRSHFDKRPFSCDVCPKKFAHKQNVVKHYQRKHPGAVYSNSETDASVAYKTWRNIQNNLISMPLDDTEQILG